MIDVQREIDNAGVAVLVLKRDGDGIVDAVVVGTAAGAVRAAGGGLRCGRSLRAAGGAGRRGRCCAVSCDGNPLGVVREEVKFARSAALDVDVGLVQVVVIREGVVDRNGEVRDLGLERLVRGLRIAPAVTRVCRGSVILRRLCPRRVGGAGGVGEPSSKFSGAKTITRDFGFLYMRFISQIDN